MAASLAAISPLSPGSHLDGWDTQPPTPSSLDSPVPTKCFDLPDYDPKTSKRNHSRTKDSQWNTSSYPKQATPLQPQVVPERPKPIRLATPNTGYPFPYVLSRPTTPLEPPQTLSHSHESSSSSSSSETSSSSNSSQPPSSSFSDSSSTPSSSQCSTPQDEDEPPTYQSRSTTPHEIQHRRTKNAANTPGAPPPLGFIGSGHASSYIDYEDVKKHSKEEEEAEDDNEQTPKKLANPLVTKLQSLTVDSST